MILSLIVFSIRLEINLFLTMKYFSNKLSQTPKRALSFINKRYHQLVFKYHPKLSDSKVFCISPWIQLHAQTNGYVGPCCMASMNEANYLSDLNDNPNLLDAWNSEKMRQLRLAMLKGEKSSICQNCYKYEELGNESERIKYNKDYVQYIDRVFKTDKTGSVLKMRKFYC
jgi:hypothetical protein